MHLKWTEPVAEEITGKLEDELPAIFRLEENGKW